jgi:hypothetical protein
MKKLLFLLFTCLVITATSYAQWYPANNGLKTYNKNDRHLNSDSTAVAGDVFIANWDYQRYNVSYRDTTSEAGDTVTTSASEWWTLSIIPSDTIYVSSSSAYPITTGKNDAYIVLPGEEFKAEKMNTRSLPKYYYKKYGWGTPSVRVKWEGY